MGYILFSSKDKISIYATYTWDGIIEYSYNNKEWNEWEGEEIINNNIYMRGINNTAITNSYRWIINGNNIKCQGNIDNLLDYRSVINNVCPRRTSFCFTSMFWGADNLIEAPKLLITDSSFDCYRYMFANCNSLTNISKIVVSTVENNCCYRMMLNNYSLKMSPTFSNFHIAKEAVINQNILEGTSVTKINVNNKLYDINVLKLL